MEFLNKLLQTLIVIPLSALIMLLYFIVLWFVIVVGGLGISVVSIFFYLVGITKWVIGIDDAR